MSEMQKNDKRQFVRLKAYHLVKYRLLSDAGTQAPAVLATIKDIGAGGICLRTEENLPLSALVELRINFPHLPNPINAQAKVAWTRQIAKGKRYEIGMQFVNIDEQLQKIIDAQVKGVTERLSQEEKKGISHA